MYQQEKINRVRYQVPSQFQMIPQRPNDIVFDVMIDKDTKALKRIYENGEIPEDIIQLQYELYTN